MRKLFFWIHLCVGIAAAAVVMIMAVTGVLLTYERQMIEWADRQYRSRPEAAAGQRLPVEDLLAKVQTSEGKMPSAVTLRAFDDAPLEATLGPQQIVYFDAYSGERLGVGSAGIRSFFRTVTDWHRWLGAKDASRNTARQITGVSNLMFLFLTLSGMYLWLPRKWSWSNTKAVLLFRGGASGKARDFNWHNVIGIWCAIPLVFIITGALVISFPWATNLVYTLTGTTPPPAPARGGGAGPRPGGAAGQVESVALTGLNGAWAQAVSSVPGWQSVTLRVPQSERAPFAFSVDKLHRGRPDQRTTVTVPRDGGQAKLEGFENFNQGRKVRTWLRWIHTGEALGFVGQTIAGIASGGAAVLAYTGIALSLRRFTAWRSRRGLRREQVQPSETNSVVRFS